MATKRILIVDDEENIGRSLRLILEREGYGIAVCRSIREFRVHPDAERADAFLFDVRLPDGSGIDLLRSVRQNGNPAPAVMISGHGTIADAVEATRAGAFDFLEKPLSRDKVLLAVKNALEHSSLRAENERLRDLVGISPKMIGSSPAFQRAVEQASMAARSDARVLLIGESGTGKELLAAHIHQNSPFAAGPFVKVNCAAIPTELIETELFGHEKGAFTGAQYRKKGKFEVADGGSVFLDEISDISLRTQTDLLRVLQEKEIVRVGGNQQIKVDFRCIAATNKNLEALVKAGSFRPDLYYRLHVFCIDLPPLRERREDIPLLVNHFLNKFCMATSRPIPQISAEALETLMRHDWPGNVRELENAVERAMVVGRGSEIRPSDFSFQFQVDEPKGGKTLEDIERAHIERILRETQHNLSRAARILDIDRTTLYNKLRRYGLR